MAELVALGFRFLLAIVFTLAGLAKLHHRTEFAEAVRRYDLLPPRLVAPIAATIPLIELASGASIGVGFATSIVALLLALLLSVFAGAVAINMLRGRDIDCGCFTRVSPRRITWTTVLKSALLALAAAVVAFEAPRVLSVDSIAFGATGATVSTGDALAMLIAVTAGLLAAALVREATHLRKLSSNFASNEELVT